MFDWEVLRIALPIFAVTWLLGAIIYWLHGRGVRGVLLRPIRQDQPGADLLEATGGWLAGCFWGLLLIYAVRSGILNWPYPPEPEGPALAVVIWGALLLPSFGWWFFAGTLLTREIKRRWSSRHRPQAAEGGSPHQN